MVSAKRTLRNDAQRNVNKLQQAALNVFTRKGLGAPLEEIAREAGVSIGTLYNRFTSREDLIDAVIPNLVTGHYQRLCGQLDDECTAHERVITFVHAMIDLQIHDPALNDAVTSRFPNSVLVSAACTEFNVLGSKLVAQAHTEGTLSRSFTSESLTQLLWLAGLAAREPEAPAGWRDVLLEPIQQPLNIPLQ